MDFHLRAVPMTHVGSIKVERPPQWSIVGTFDVHNRNEVMLGGHLQNVMLYVYIEIKIVIAALAADASHSARLCSIWKIQQMS